MANLVYGGKTPNVITYNNADVHHVIYGGKTIWNKRITVTVKKGASYTIPADNMKIISIGGEKNPLPSGSIIKKGCRIDISWENENGRKITIEFYEKASTSKSVWCMMQSAPQPAKGSTTIPKLGPCTVVLEY